MTSPFVDTAQRYFDAGWEPLPIPFGEKEPPPKGYTGHRKSHHVDQDTLNGWLSRPEPRNIALHIPDDVLGIDVDAYDGKAGAESLADGESKYGKLPDTWIVSSRDDGVSGIRLYQVPAGLSWRGDAGPGIDVIQSGHRYVVTAPSKHPSGREYGWNRGGIPDIDALPELPDTWVAFLNRGIAENGAPIEEASVTEANEWLKTLPAGTPCRRVGEALTDRVERMNVGNRYDTMRDGTWELVRLGFEGHAGSRKALKTLYAEYAGALAGERNGSNEFKRAVKDAVEKTRSEGDPAQECDCEVIEERTRWHDFGALVRGERKRSLPEYGARTDGVAMLYPGKEHSIYAETEAGKTMLEAAIVKWCLDNGLPVAVVDFEEGDELEWGSRLLDMGTDTATIMDQQLFRYGTPATSAEADKLLVDILEMRPALVVFEGVSACYGVYGWQIKENDSATAFRSHLIRPAIDLGIATLSSDHVTKVKDGRGRYAIGGVMKLNMVNGVAYMLESYQPIRRGEIGASLLYVTKDRPGSVKSQCSKTKEPGILRFGTLNVDSTMEGFLDVFISPPPDEEAAQSQRVNTLVDDVYAVIASLPGQIVESRRKLRAAVAVAGTSARGVEIDAAADYLVSEGRIVECEGPRRAVGFRVPATVSVSRDQLN